MSLTVFVICLAAWLYLGGGPEWLRNRARRIRSRIRGGAGASAAARARQLRTPTVRIAEAFGIRTQAGALAARSEAGAEGEQRTAVRLAPLARRGWTILHDRALPRSRANVDHLAISPTGVVLVLDTKRWSARYPVTVQRGRLHHGHSDVTDRLAGLRHEAAAVAEVLGTHVVPVVLMDGPALYAELLELDGIRIIAAADARRLLPAIARAQRNRIPRPRIAADADRLLPPYTQGHTR
jgi:hypothetical protein